jgi:hypothetical protein
MRYVKRWTMLMPVLFMAACSSPDPPPPAKTVFDPLTRQLDRARDVQKTVDENSEKLRKAADAQERGDTPP